MSDYFYYFHKVSKGKDANSKSYVKHVLEVNKNTFVNLKKKRKKIHKSSVLILNVFYNVKLLEYFKNIYSVRI